MYKEPIFFFLKIFVKMGESSLFLQAKQSCRNRPSCIGNELLLKFLMKVILLYAKVFLLCHAFDYLTVIVALYRSRLINLTGFYMRRGLKSIFNKVAGLQSQDCNRLQHRCFAFNFAKF